MASLWQKASGPGHGRTLSCVSGQDPEGLQPPLTQTRPSYKQENGLVNPNAPAAEDNLLLPRDKTEREQSGLCNQSHLGGPVYNQRMD